jgi:hypothetical protein
MEACVGMLDFLRNHNKTEFARNGRYEENAGAAKQELSIWNVRQIVQFNLGR